MEATPLRIAIIGGGIAGLSFGGFLARLIPNHASRLIVDIYESTASLEAQVGAGLNIYPSAWAIYEYVGIDKDLAKYAGSTVTEDSVPIFRIRKSDEPEGRDLFTLFSKAGAVLSFHRADLQSVLLSKLPTSFCVHKKKRLQSYIGIRGGVLLQFEDGSTAPCDLVIGADGLQSNVRRTMLKETKELNPFNKEHDLERLADPYWSGTIVYRGMIPMQKVVDAGWGHHRALKQDVLEVGKNGSIMMYPIPHRGIINFAACKTWPYLEGYPCNHRTVSDLLLKEATGEVATVTTHQANEWRKLTAIEATNDDPWVDNSGGGSSSNGRPRWVSNVQQREVHDAFKGWEPDIQAIIAHLEGPLRWAVHAIHPLPTYRGEFTCLIGDSAHAMVPHIGQGAGQSIFDAFVLARLIASALDNKTRTLQSQLGAILDAYDVVRRPEAQKAVEMAKSNCLHYVLLAQDANGRVIDVDTDTDEGIDDLHRSMAHNWSLGWDKQAPFEQAERAVKILTDMTSPSSKRPNL